PEAAGPMALADLEAQKESTSDVNESMAYGGRLGLWLPEIGLTAGASVFFNTPYTAVSASDITLWQLDAGYHKGNWDLRFEYANLVQGTRGITDERIRRRGLYAQVAYRPYDAVNCLLQKAEAVFRYSRARFNGIDATTLDVSAFESPIDVPVDRDQYTFGINYYFYPSLVLKFAYEINHEVGGLQLKDNLFTAQLAWGF